MVDLNLDVPDIVERCSRWDQPCDRCTPDDSGFLQKEVIRCLSLDFARRRTPRKCPKLAIRSACCEKKWSRQQWRCEAGGQSQYSPDQSSPGYYDFPRRSHCDQKILQRVHIQSFLLLNVLSLSSVRLWSARRISNHYRSYVCQ